MSHSPRYGPGCTMDLVDDNLCKECHAYDGYQNFCNFFLQIFSDRIVTFVGSQSDEVLPVSDQSEHSIISPENAKNIA